MQGIWLERYWNELNFALDMTLLSRAWILLTNSIRSDRRLTSQHIMNIQSIADLVGLAMTTSSGIQSAPCCSSDIDGIGEEIWFIHQFTH